MSDESNVVSIGGKPALRVVGNDEPTITEQGVMTRLLLLGPPDESPTFLAGMQAGQIIERLQQAQIHEVSYSELSPMPMNKRYVKTIDKIAEFLRGAVSYSPDEEDDDMVWCTFRNLGSVLQLV
jgi:hypothetical protein